MDDRSLYATILGMEAPWGVERVELREVEQAVHVGARALGRHVRLSGVRRPQPHLRSRRAELAALGYLSLPDPAARRGAASAGTFLRRWIRCVGRNSGSSNRGATAA